MLTKTDLNRFTGSEIFYRHPLGVIYTEGIKYLAQNARAYWLIDIIASYQGNVRITQDPMLQEIQFWKLKVSQNNSAILTCERDTDDVVITQKIEFTDFPLDEVKIYLSNKTLLLPSEY